HRNGPWKQAFRAVAADHFWPAPMAPALPVAFGGDGAGAAPLMYQTGYGVNESGQVTGGYYGSNGSGSGNAGADQGSGFLTKAEHVLENAFAGITGTLPRPAATPEGEASGQQSAVATWLPVILIIVAILVGLHLLERVL